MATRRYTRRKNKCWRSKPALVASFFVPALDNPGVSKSLLDLPAIASSTCAGTTVKRRL